MKIYCAKLQLISVVVKRNQHTEINRVYNKAYD